MCKVMFAMERETKNTVRFTEVLTGKMTNPVVGTIYLQKDALKAKGWEEGQGISLDISIVDEIPQENATTAAAKNAAATAKYKEEKEKRAAGKKAAAKKPATKKATTKGNTAARTTKKTAAKAKKTA